MGTYNDIYRRIHFAVMEMEAVCVSMLGTSGKEMHDRMSKQVLKWGGLAESCCKIMQQLRS